MKHIWISGLKLNLLEERHENLRGLDWIGTPPSSYSVHIFPNGKDTAGIIALSDAFGGMVSWAKYEGKNHLIGKQYDTLDKDELDFLTRKYPAFVEAIKNLDS